MEATKRTFLNSDLLQVGYMGVRPAQTLPSYTEAPPANMLALPLSGVFAKHDGARQQMLATPCHALLMGAGRPYRISFPGGIGDETLILRFTDEALSRVAPEAMMGDAFNAPAFAPRLLLPAPELLARSLLWRKLASGDYDRLDIEESCTHLLNTVLVNARRERQRSRGASRPSASAHRIRQLGRVMEAITLEPERKWTLAALANLACVSPFHLAHMFRAEVGAPLYAFVLRTRLAKALEAVLDDDADLSAIAYDTGFASHSHFTSRFRAMFGTTPLALRRNASVRMATELRKTIQAKELVAA
jgi:AraC family transcriptional regulator